jgi:ParB-like chromosome segregation protein Spo0J
MTNVERRLPSAPKLEATYNYVAHDLANDFEMIKGVDFEELKKDIKEKGILQPITLYDDGSGLKILDGRNRYGAAQAVGYAFSPKDFKTFTGSLKEAEAFVNSVNVKRRHMNPAQIQAYIRKLVARYPNESNRQIARICGHSHVTVGKVIDKIKNPPERIKFEEFKKTFDEFPDEQRLEFVKEFAADIREMLGA